MSDPVHGTILKSGPLRTVSVEWDGARPRVVKRFHARAALGRLRDGHRARREYASLARLRAAGVRVPTPVCVRRARGGWELVTELVPDAVSVRELLHGRAPWPVPTGRAAVALGRALGRLWSAGARHPDLHPGNALLDSAGEVWWIDAARARVGRPAGAAALRASLVALTAGGREHVSPGFRARFLVALLAALPPQRARELGPRRALAAELEHDGRALRQKTIRERVGRWTRESGAVVPYSNAASSESSAGSPAGSSGFVRRDLAGAEPQLLLPCTGGATRRWRDAARLSMHGVPCARPARLATSPAPVAFFELPVGARTPLDAGWRGLERRAARALGTLAGTLHDRGLAATDLAPAGVAFDAEGRALLLPTARITDLDPDERGAPARELRALAARFPLPAGRRAAFLAGWLRAQRCPAAERGALREELARG